jgi:UDP-N-acetylglucosamine--N-acetylmuramyl-(pentapeptide) pyrophosphoryl-undecaprenol N-acetylglucosamine transferase
VSGRRFAVVAGGGTGGHVFPALAVARALVARGHPPETIELVGSRRGQEATLLADAGFPLTLLPGRGISRRLRPATLLANVGALVGLASAVVTSLVSMVRDRPAVVVTVGGYASFPAGVAAVVLRIPLVLVNTDSVPGSVHRLLGRFAAASAVGFPGTPLPRAVVTGTPVREEVQAVRRTPDAARAARVALGLPADRPTVAVTGGSLGAGTLNAAAVGLERGWAERSDRAVYHVTGRRNWDELGSPTGPGDTEGGAVGLFYRRVPFETQMPLLYSAADVVVGRAGAMTVAELAVAGVPSVLVPLPGAPGDHQTKNARALVDAGGAVLLPDAQCDEDHLVAVLDRLLDDPGRLAAMSDAARSAGHRDAAGRVAEVVESHAR